MVLGFERLECKVMIPDKITKCKRTIEDSFWAPTLRSPGQNEEPAIKNKKSVGKR